MGVNARGHGSTRAVDRHRVPGRVPRASETAAAPRRTAPHVPAGCESPYGDRLPGGVARPRGWAACGIAGRTVQVRVDALLSAQLASNYKPGPVMYLTALRLLECEPAESGMVAALRRRLARFS
jgi:hypothetical protein